MKLMPIQKGQWNAVQKIYAEAFPKAEQKPFWTIRLAVLGGHTEVLVAEQKDTLLGLVSAVPYKDIVLIDYLAVSKDGRGKGTGSRILQKLSEYYKGKRMILQIERVVDTAENYEQRVSRRKFYLKNGFTSTGIYTDATSGEMEILILNGTITEEEYLKALKNSLGTLFFKFSKTHLIK